MPLRRKKGRHKRRIRSSTKRNIFIICALFILFSIYGIYTSVFEKKIEEKEQVIYKHSSKYQQQYQVELKDNKYMEEESLTKEQLYVTDLIEKLRVNFNYTYEGSNPEKINCTYSVTGKLQSTYSSNGKEEEIWNKQYVILEPKEKNTTENVLEINENLDIDLKQYNELVNDFIEKMQMAITTKLYIEFNTNITAHVNGEMMLDQYTNRLEVSLGDKVTKIVGDEEDSKEKEVNKKIQVTKEGNKTVAVISSVVLIISIYVMIKVQKETKTMNKITNMFKVELNQILGACGDRIVKIDSEIKTTGITLIELKDINELVKLSEELYKPILYYQVPNRKEAWFCLTLENETYRYILK